MIERFIAIAFPLLFLMITGPALAQAATPAKNVNVIGTIVDMEGSVSVTPNSPSGGQKPVIAAVGMPVHINDIVATAAASRAFIRFIDNTKLTLAENTNIRIDNYVFNPDDNKNNKAAYSALLGAFQYVSGLIGKKKNPDVHIETPVGSIGIRGTDFWAGKALDEYGVAVYSVAVSDGKVVLKTDGGSVILHKGEGTSVRDRASKPAPAQKWGKDAFEYIATTVKLHGSFPADAYARKRNIEKQEGIKNDQNSGNTSHSPGVNHANPAPGSAPVTDPNNTPVSPASSPVHGADNGSGTQKNPEIPNQQLEEGNQPASTSAPAIDVSELASNQREYLVVAAASHDPMVSSEDLNTYRQGYEQMSPDQQLDLAVGIAQKIQGMPQAIRDQILNNMPQAQ